MLAVPDKRRAKQQTTQKVPRPRQPARAPHDEETDTTTDSAVDVALTYEPNPKHKEPWQLGARGSLCPKDADGPTLLANSQADPKHQGKRYATDGTRAYCGHEHS